MRTTQAERERVYSRAANDDINWLIGLAQLTRIKAHHAPPEDRPKIYDEFYAKLHRMGFYKVKPTKVSKNNAE